MLFSFDNGNAIFEPAGELEVNDFVNISSQTQEEDDRPTSSKRRKRPTPKWKKDIIFRKQTH